ncbi:MAG: DDE-type integrase/transposase/recombinase, partial [Clostridiales bacterium]|nr:DDE-type integrase/transposase/recombinase [Clostridiales bacterium]
MKRSGLVKTRKTAKDKQKAVELVLELSNTKYNLTESVVFMSRKYKVCERVMWRWLNRYNGTIESLQNKSSKPLTAHPASQTDDEKEHIKQLTEQNPTWGYTEIYGELRTQFAYGRHYLTMYKWIRKNNIKDVIEYYKPKKYHTPEMFGQKMQLDVKYVPKECYIGSMVGKKKRTKAYHYQFTMIDETTRECFVYPYDNKRKETTVDFIKRAIVHFGYVPQYIQTDNGKEFVNRLFNDTAADLKFIHKRIKVRTPRHNGKVERKHRTDQEKFYNHLTYSTLDELRVE